MALSNLFAWNEEKVASACGSACGAADKPKKSPLLVALPAALAISRKKSPPLVALPAAAGDK